MSLTPDGLNFEQPMVISRGKHKITGADWGKLTYPLCEGTTDTNDSNKIWMTAYSDTTYKASMLGACMQNKPPSGYADGDKLGLAPHRRDARFLYQGTIAGAIYKGDTGLKSLQPLSPGVTGFTNWKFGQALAGFNYNKYSHSSGEIDVQLNTFLDGIVPRFEETGVAIASNKASLAHAPIQFDYIACSGAISGYMTMKIISSGLFALTSGNVGVLWTTGAFAITTMVGDDAALAKVRYWYYPAQE